MAWLAAGWDLGIEGLCAGAGCIVGLFMGAFDVFLGQLVLLSKLKWGLESMGGRVVCD